MKSHYIVIADQAHLRIFAEKSEPGQSTPRLEEVYAMHLSTGNTSYADNDTDMAGRFQGSRQQGSSPGAPAARGGMSIDERLPMQREMERRNLEDLAYAIEIFLAKHPEATWDFAAGPSSHNAVLERLPAALRSRLWRSLPKDLVNQPVAELRDRFARAA